MKSECKDPLTRQLSLCGQIAEHKAQMARQHGGDETAILDALDPEEKETLALLLSRLQERWLKDHAAHHK